jgi:hypothetical protein
MAEKKFRVVHYLNQFFGQVGGEEKATILRRKPVTVLSGRGWG